MSLEQSIRNIRNTFSNPAHREHLIEEMQFAAFRHFAVPYVCVEALDVMIPRFLEGSLEKTTAIVMAEARKTPGPSSIVSSGETLKKRYSFRFLGMKVDIGRYAMEPGSAMQVRAQLDSEYILRYAGYIDGELVHSSEHEPEREPGRFISENTPLFLFRNIYADRYRSFNGVAIKRPSKSRILRLAGESTILPRDRYYIMMFSKQKQVFFDDKGKIQKAVDVRR